MKTKILCVVFFILSPALIFAQCEATALGSIDFNACTATDMTVTSAGVPYTIISDLTNSGKATVKSWNGANWVNVGSAGFSAGAIISPSIVADASNNLFVCYIDKTNNNRVTVMKYNGTSWITLGSSGFGSGSPQNLCLALDNSSVPYVAYTDAAMGNKSLSLCRFDGSNWSVIYSISHSKFVYTGVDMVIGNGNVPYILTTGFERFDFLVDIGNNKTMPGFHINWKCILYSYKSSVLDIENNIYYQETSQYADIKYIELPAITKTNTGDLALVFLTNSEWHPNSSYLNYRNSVNNYAYEQAFEQQNTKFSSIAIAAFNNSSQLFAYTVKGNSNKVTVIQKSGKKYTLLLSNAGYSNTYLNAATDGSGNPFISFLNGTGGKPSIMKYNGSGLDWTILESPRISNGAVDNIAVTTDSNGIPYMIFSDNGNSSKASVKKYTDSGWINIGTGGFSPGAANYTSIAINKKGEPFASFRDGTTNKASVMKYNGSNWVNVGSNGFSAGITFYNSIAFDPKDTPYVVYADYSNSSKATVMKFDGSNWIVVGKVGFSANQAFNTDIAFDNNGVPFVVFGDGSSSGGKATVMKFNGTSWVNVGSAQFSAGNTQFTTIDFDRKNNTPYVSFQDNGNSNKLNVMKFNGSSWVNVGNGSVSEASASYPTLTMDNEGTPYVAFEDGQNGNRASLMKYNGSGWVYVGKKGFSSGTSQWTCVAINKYNIPYVVLNETTAKAYKIALTGIGAYANGNQLCSGTNLILKAIGGSQYKWSGPSGFSSSLDTAVIANTTVSNSGKYLVNISNNICANYSILDIVVDTRPNLSIQSRGNWGKEVCFDQFDTLIANGGNNYLWSNGSANDTIIIYHGDSIKRWTVLSTNGYCTVVDSFRIDSIYPPIKLSVQSGSNGNYICPGSADTLIATGAESYIWNNSNTNDSVFVHPVLTTTYLVTGINSGKCKDTSSVTVKVLPLIDISTNTSGVTITAVETGAKYQWLNCSNDSILIGDTAKSFTAIKNGNYAVIITKNGCTDTSECISISSLGILQSNYNRQVFYVYPNPANSEFFIYTNENNLSEYRLLNSTGKIVNSGLINTGKTKISTADITAGIYIIEIYESNMKIRQKLVIIK